MEEKWIFAILSTQFSAINQVIKLKGHCFVTGLPAVFYRLTLATRAPTLPSHPISQDATYTYVKMQGCHSQTVIKM